MEFSWLKELLLIIGFPFKSLFYGSITLNKKFHLKHTGTVVSTPAQVPLGGIHHYLFLEGQNKNVPVSFTITSKKEDTPPPSPTRLQSTLGQLGVSISQVVSHANRPASNPVEAKAAWGGGGGGGCFQNNKRGNICCFVG